MKIGICGTMSVGKTTLVNALKKEPEFKDYNFRTERSKYLNDLGIPLNTDSTVKGQTIFLAERATELMQKDIITDRTVIDVMAFTFSADSIDYIVADDFCVYASHLLREYDYIFYISPEGIDIENNKIRSTDIIYRNKIDKKILLLLQKYNHFIKNLIYIPPDVNFEQRIKFIKKIIWS